MHRPVRHLVTLIAVCTAIGLGQHRTAAQQRAVEHLAARLPDVGALLASPSALTTGLAHVRHDMPWLDDEDEGTGKDEAGRMETLPRDADGGFVLRPGNWSYLAQSYCLLPGTAGRATGEGFLDAPLVGPKAPIISRILARSYALPDIPQERIQTLLWAVLTGARFSDLPDEIRHDAAQLLPPGELAALQADARTRMTDALRDRLIDRMPAPALAIYRAESDLRDLLVSGADYEQMADAAVLDGDPEPQPGDRVVPPVRWSYDPDGYFVRFARDDYRATRVEAMLPEAFEVVRDSRGRLTRLRAVDGWTSEADYDDTIAPLHIDGDPGLTGYAFKRIRITRPAGDRFETREWHDTGWTFVGRSNGRGRIGPLVDAGTPRLVLARWMRGAAAASADDRWSDAGERYAKSRYDKSGLGAPSDADIDRLTDEKHYGKGVKAALGGDVTAKGDWLADHGNRVRRAAAYVLCRLEGGCEPPGGEGDEGKGARGPKRFSPSGHAAVPGAQGAQRGGLSGRSAR